MSTPNRFYALKRYLTSSSIEELKLETIQAIGEQLYGKGERNHCTFQTELDDAVDELPEGAKRDHLLRILGA